MEILFELLVWLLGTLGEVLLQLLFELLAEFGLRALGAPFRRPLASPLLAALGYTIYGALAGGLSLLVFPDALLHHPMARLCNLVLTPVVAGILMSLLGSWRQRRGDALIRMDRFSYGALFALAMALVRYALASPG